MAKPNYQFEKRQKERAKKKKQEEKRLKKLNNASTPSGETPDSTPKEGESM